jgi:hypothetical protein
MSWSVSAVGTPEGVANRLDAYAEELSGQSKDEFMEAKPYLQGLVRQMVKQNVRLAANGHASFSNGSKSYGNINVTIESFYGDWCG